MPEKQESAFEYFKPHESDVSNDKDLYSTEPYAAAHKDPFEWTKPENRLRWAEGAHLKNVEEALSLGEQEKILNDLQLTLSRAEELAYQDQEDNSRRLIVHTLQTNDSWGPILAEILPETYDKLENLTYSNPVPLEDLKELLLQSQTLLKAREIENRLKQSEQWAKIKPTAYFMRQETEEERRRKKNLPPLSNDTSQL